MVQEAVKGVTESVEQGGQDLVQESLYSQRGLVCCLIDLYAYVATVAVIQMIYKCTSEEFVECKSGVKKLYVCWIVLQVKDLGSCIEKRQAYCCFSSPLSRIINEQVRNQFGENYGSAKNPQCKGIPLDQISEIDWDQINLDE